ncbi:uncharacterized protein LOC143037053 [Oratosquilla oratoria]|uniref:uncharacterized protein LOC143037053 n=1 Tax=Oratosquilla oratoria TaxID=337810 RepID=UPI003F773365
MPKCFMIRRPLTVRIQQHVKKKLFPDMNPPPVWLDEDHLQEKKMINEPCKVSSLDNKAVSAEVAKKTSSTYSPSVTKVSTTARQPQNKVHSEISATFSQESVQLPLISTTSRIQTQHFPPVSPGTDAMHTQQSLGLPCVITASGFGAKSAQETIALSRVSKVSTAQSQYSSQVHLGSSVTCTQESDTLPSATPNILHHTQQVHPAADTTSTQEIVVRPRVAEPNTKPRYSSQIHLNASDSSRDESASLSHVIPPTITQPQYSLHKYTNAVSTSSNGKAALPSGEASANSKPRVSSNIYSNAGMAATQKAVSLPNVKAKTCIQPSFSSLVEDDASTDKLVTTPFVTAKANIWPRHSSFVIPDDVASFDKGEVTVSHVAQRWHPSHPNDGIPLSRTPIANTCARGAVNDQPCFPSQTLSTTDVTATQKAVPLPNAKAKSYIQPSFSSLLDDDVSPDQLVTPSFVTAGENVWPRHSSLIFPDAVAASSKGEVTVPHVAQRCHPSHMYPNDGVPFSRATVASTFARGAVNDQPCLTSQILSGTNVPSVQEQVRPPHLIAPSNNPFHFPSNLHVGAHAQYMHNLATGPNIQPQFYSQRQPSVGAASSIESMTWPRTTSNAPPRYSSPFFSGAASAYKPPAKTGCKRASNICPYYTPEMYSNACASSMNTPASFARHAEAENSQDWYPSQIPSRVGATSSTRPLNFPWLTAASHTQNRYFSDIHSDVDVPVCVGSALSSASAANIQPRSSLHTYPETGVTSMNELFTFPYGAKSEKIQTQWPAQAQSITAPKSTNQFSGLPNTQLRSSSHVHSDSGPVSSNECCSRTHATARAEITNTQPQCFSYINSNSCGTSSNEWGSLSCSTKEDCAQLPYPRQTKPSTDVASTHEPPRPTFVTEDRVVNSVLGSESYAVNTYIQLETQLERIPSSPHAQKKRFVCWNGNKPFVQMNCPSGNPSVRLSSQDPGLRKDTPYMNRLENQIKGKLVGSEDLYAEPWLLYHCQSVSDSEPHSMDHEHILKGPIEVLYNLETFLTHEIQVQNFSRSESVSSSTKGNVVSKSEIKSDNFNSGRSFICNKCDAKFDNKSDLDNHSETHKPVLSSTSKGYKKKRSANRPFLSDIYSIEFILMSDLEFHINGEHEPVSNINSKTREDNQNISDRPFICKVCDAKFYLESHLDTHRELHNRSVIPKDKQSIIDRHFVCKTCDADFALKSELDLHIGKHEPVFDPKLTVSEGNQTLLDLPFACKVCDNKFSLESDLQTHSALHKPSACPKSKDKGEMNILSSSFVCKKCDVHFTLKSDLDSHISEHELTLDPKSKVKDDSQKISDGSFVCDICNAKFALKSDLDTHSDLHNLPVPFESKDKGKTINAQVERTNQNIPDGFFMCEICNAKFALKSDLDTHSDLHNLSVPFKSKDKGKIISTQVERTNQSISGGSFMYKICNAKFALKSDLDTHSDLHNLLVAIKSKGKGKIISAQVERTNHNISDGSFMCEICKAKFALKSDLDTHSDLHNLFVPFKSKDKGKTTSVQVERTNQSISGGSFMCETCNAKFDLKSDLDTHSDLHNLSVPFKSKDKGKIISAQVERTNQSISGSSFMCKICNAKFALKSDLDTHSDLHNLLVAIKSKNKGKTISAQVERTNQNISGGSFMCKICSAKFALKSDLDTHSDLHNLSVPFKSKDKGKTISAQVERTNQSISGGSFMCEICNAKFALKSDLDIHSDLHNLSVPFKPKGKRKNSNVEVERTNQNISDGSFMCAICSAKFALKSDLDTHIDLHKTPVSSRTRFKKRRNILSNLLVDNTFDSIFADEIESDLQIVDTILDPSPKEKEDSQISSDVFFACNRCDSKFALKSELETHNKLHKQSKSDLDTHSYLHKVDKAFDSIFANEIESDLQIVESILDPSPKDKEDSQISSNIFFACNRCDSKFALKSELDTHNKIHKQSKSSKSKPKRKKNILNGPFLCKVCNATFSLKSGLNLHSLQHEPVLNTESNVSDDSQNILNLPFVCKVCDAKFALRIDLDNHNHHETSKSKFNEEKNTSDHPFVCKVCDVHFTQKCDLDLHNDEHQPVLDSRLKDKKSDHNSLNYPPVSEVSNTKLRKPRKPRAKSKINTLSPSLECKDCDAKFVLKSDLDVHQRLHKPSEPLGSKLKGKNDVLTRSFVCKVCNACFSLQSDLDLHSGGHKSISDPKSKLGEDSQTISNRPFICTTCNAEFSLKSDLDAHANTHKPSKPKKSKARRKNRDRPFVCDICDAKFALSYGLKNHYIVHKNIGSSEFRDKRINDDRPFVCEVCTSRFATKFELDYHSGLHEPISHCSCSRCGQRFIRKSARNAHLLSHFCEVLESHILKSSDRHHCVTCQRGFSDRRTLVKHVEQHMKGEITRCPVCNAQFFIGDEGFSLYAHVRIIHPDYLKDPKYE